MIVAYVIAGVVAYFTLGIGVVGVGEVVVESDGTYRSINNNMRSLFILIWPLALVVLVAAVFCLGVGKGVQRLSKRYGLKQIIFSPGEAARRLACATQARYTKKPSVDVIMPERLPPEMRVGRYRDEPD